MAILLAFLLSAVQDEPARRAEALIQQLDADSPDERDAAEKALLEGGAAFEAALERASREGKLEVRSRCRDILRSLALDRKRREFWSPAAPITLDFKDEPLKQALDRLAKLTGYAVSAGTVNPEAKLTLSLKGASFLQAVDAICLSMGCWYRWNGTAIVLGKAEAGHSRCHAGPILLSAALGSGQDSDGKLSLDLDLEWDPGLRLRWCEIEIESAVDDQGGAVTVAEPKNPSGYSHRFVYRRAHLLPAEGEPRCTAKDGINLNEISKDATRLTSVKGRIQVVIPEEVRKIRLDKKGAKVPAGDVTASLQDLSFQPNYRGWNASIDLDLSRTPPAKHRALFAFLLNSKVAFVRDVQSFETRGSGASSGGSMEDPLQNVGRTVSNDKMPEEAGPAAVELNVVTDVWEKTFPFEFKDVRRSDSGK